MLKYISGTAGALCGIAQGIYIVFKEAGSTPDSAIIVVRLPSTTRASV